jgi:hypothetical protein
MSVEIIDCEQGTELWFSSRAGLPTASEFHTVMAKGKDGGRSLTREAYMRKLAGEILTGEPAPEGYSNAHMERGKLLEGSARELFAYMHDVEPQIIGFLRNGKKGASPDSLINENAGLEIKTAIPAVQIERLQLNRLPPEYVAQVQGGLWVSERDTWFFLSYCPKLPPLIVEVHRDEAYIAKMAAAVDTFNAELDDLVNSFRGAEQFRRVA